MAEIPSDPPITGGAFPSGSGETQQRDPLSFPGRNLPQGSAELRQRPQVTMFLHQPLEALFLLIL
jgi:hypothetical protein